MHPKEFTPQQYRKFNGQSIMLALESMGGTATADDLAKHIGDSIGQHQEIVKPEVSHVLRRGIANGFLQRRGKKYFLFNGGSTYEVDSSTRKRKVDLQLQSQTDSNKRIRFSRRNGGGDDETDSSSELNQQTIDDLQEIIATANEDTKKATILATKAAKRAKLASMKIQEIVEGEDGLQED